MTLDLQHLSESTFVIVAISTDEEGNEDIFAAEGKAIYNAADNTISVYKVGVEEPLFILQEDEFSEIQQADEEEFEELQADYFMVVDVESPE